MSGDLSAVVVFRNNTLKLIFWIQDPADFPICLLCVQPLPTEEYCGDTVGCVCHFHAVQKPTGAQTGVVVLHPDFLQFSHVEHFQNEAVRLLALEKVTKLLPQLTAARVPVGAVNGDENVGVRSSSFLITSDHDYLILDGYKASSFTGKALDGLGALESQELIPFRRERDGRVTAEDVPGKVRR